MTKQNRILMSISKILEIILNVLLVVLMSLIVVLVFSNVISRYFLGSAIAWSEEISRFLLIWLAFFGAVSAYIRNEHLGLDLVVKKLSPRMAAAVGLIANLLIIYALGLTVNGGYDLAMRSLDWLSPATSTSYGYVYMVVPLVGSVMIIQTVFKIGLHFKVLVKGKEEPAC